MDHELPPQPTPSDGPDHRPSPAHDLDPRLLELVNAQIEAAVDRQGPIPTDVARAIAACLHDFASTPVRDHLRRFAVGGVEGGRDLWRPALTEVHDGRVPADLQRWTCWLATYSLASMPAETGGVHPSDGDALHALLDTADPDGPLDVEHLVEDWSQRYHESYRTLEDMLQGMTHLEDAERKMVAIAEAYHLSDFVSIDRDAILDEITAEHTVLDAGGRLHVFLGAGNQE